MGREVVVLEGGLYRTLGQCCSRVYMYMLAGGRRARPLTVEGWCEEILGDGWLWNESRIVRIRGVTLR